MREIKFRAFGEDGKMHYNILPNGNTYMKLLKVTGTDCAEYELSDARDSMQFIGLTDRHGKEIYEGDIVKGFSGNGVVEWFDNLNWDSGGSLHSGFYCKEWFEYKDPGCMSYHDGFNDCEVIGNIYSDPHLLIEMNQSDSDYGCSSGDCSICFGDYDG
jgi:uncharacterized phage protein (TIGR01671 family)